MEIVFTSRKMEKACNSERESIRMWGAENARRIRQRLAELAAAETLANDPVPKKDDRGIDLAKINRIRVLAVEDSHGD